jgi:hypothetical protein
VIADSASGIAPRSLGAVDGNLHRSVFEHRIEFRNSA